MPSFRIPTPLRPYSGGNSQVEVSGDTVGSALDDLTNQYPDLRQHLYNGQQLRSFVNIYLNQEDIRYVDGVNTVVDANDTLMIIPSIAGGKSPNNGRHPLLNQPKRQWWIHHIDRSIAHNDWPNSFRSLHGEKQR